MKSIITDFGMVRNLVITDSVDKVVGLVVTSADKQDITERLRTAVAEDLGVERIQVEFHQGQVLQDKGAVTKFTVIVKDDADEVEEGEEHEFYLNDAARY